VRLDIIRIRDQERRRGHRQHDARESGEEQGGAVPGGQFEMLQGRGAPREGEIIELASAQGIIEKSGAWYSYKGNRIGQGKDNARNYLLSNKEIAREIEDQVRARLLPQRQERRPDQAANSA
jgi:recombination protein RecA